MVSKKHIDAEHSNAPSKSAHIWFHRTTCDRVAAILQHGLKINCENTLTTNGSWSFDAYGCRPVFLAKTTHINGYAAHAPIVFKVNVQGLTLVADFPSLVDAGAYYDDDEGMIWFKRGPDWAYRDLLDPTTDVCHRAIKKTKTAAYTNNIASERLCLVTLKKQHHTRS